MISLPTKPVIISEEGNSAIFEITQLYPGYGVTLGNVLRRILLSSLPGAAVTEVKIRNVEHEFTTIPGVKENIVDILLNVKKLRFRVQGDEPQIVKIQAKGEGAVAGKDIDSPSQITVVSKDQHIATLTDKKAEFYMELIVENGIGYLPVEMRKKEKLSVGTIAIDSIFTPVRNVNFSVENMRVGERTDFNRLRLEIQTDGTISPQDAVTEAATILTEQAATIAGLQLPPKEDAAENLKVTSVKEKKVKNKK
ncbi:MAG: DNA-directed RNA polymerase subunit alpha [Parcubacteria group bacterium GW2011_GWB1_40_14]|nr:MAG: DNA-directed RNA polymerase subunit alpha [Parcubacteria group bacterium GW2011_GWB1_40_14]